MQKLTNTLLLFFLLLTSVMSKAADKTFVLKTSGTIDTDKAYLIVYQDGTDATTGTLMNSSFTSYTISGATDGSSPQGAAAVSTTESISSNQITTDESNAFTFVSSTTSGSYYIKNNQEYYFGANSSHQWFATSNTEGFDNTVSISSSGIVTITCYSKNLGYSTNCGGTEGLCGFHYGGNNSIYLYEEVKSYTITCNTATNGTVTSNVTTAYQGTTVTLTVTPDEGYELSELTVIGQTEVETEAATDGTYTFTMPSSNVTISATFTQKTSSTTYTRTGVTPGTWQSFFLPFYIDIDNLQTVFDKIYIPYNGEELIIYDDLDDATTLTKRRVVRKASATVSTDDEDETRYTFAYSPAASTTYDIYLADFTSQTGVVIPLEMPFFAHVRSDATLTDNTLTLTGNLFGEEAQNDYNIETPIPLYTDTSLQTQDEDRIFEVIGLLTDPDDTYEDLTSLAIDPDDGTFSPIECTDMEQYHAYLMGTSATSITLHPTALSDLPNITIITDYDLNGDGLETIADAAYLISILGGADDTTGKADLNQDDTIDMTDLNLLLNHILQK